MTDLSPITPTADPSRWREPLRGLSEMAARSFALVLLFVAFGLKVPHGAFFSASNIENILLQSSVYTMAGLGMTMVIITGGIDLAAGSTIALSMVATALVMNSGPPDHRLLAEQPILCTTLAVIAGAAAGAIVGIVQGLLITGLRLVPFIVTLGGLQAVRGIAKGMAGDQEITPPSNNWLYQHLMFPVQGVKFNPQLFPPGVWATIVACILAATILRYTKLGRRIFAIGSNESTARLCGVPVLQTKILVYAIAGFFAGLAGVLEFSRLNIGQPTGAQSYELYIIAACVIGGTSLIGGVGTIFGTVIGALIIGTLYVGAQQVAWEKWVQEVVIGCIIIAAVAIDRLRHWRAR